MTKTPIAMLGIDLGKNTCSQAGLDASGAVVLRKKMTREGVVAFTSALAPCIVAMEACCGARDHAGERPHGVLMRRLDEIGIDERIKAYDEEFATLTRTDAQARHLATIQAWASSTLQPC